MVSDFETFVEWIMRHGGFVHPSLGREGNLGGGCSLAIKAEAPALKPHEILFSVPYSLTLSYLNPIFAGKENSGYKARCEPFPDHFLNATSDHDAIAYIFLMQQYLLGEDSFWFPYINILPQPDTTSQGSIPIIWNDDDLEWLQGTYLENVREERYEWMLRWNQATEALRESGWDTTDYTLDLFMWARFVFKSRQYPSIALHADADSLKPEYRPLVQLGVSLDDGPQILYPLLDCGNHSQQDQLEYDFKPGALSVAKSVQMKPGDELCCAYDKDDQLFNNTTLLRDFGFILPQSHAVELVLPPPFDTAVALDPSHVIFSTPSTVEEFYASADEMHQLLVTVRSPSRDRRGLVNPSHVVPALRHFHPTLVSMAAFRQANVIERIDLRQNPHKMPSQRLGKAVVSFFQRHVQLVLERLRSIDQSLASPRNEQQRLASLYRAEQAEILEEMVLALVDSESYLGH